LEGLLAVVGLEVTTEGIMTGTGTERDGGRVPNFGVATQRVSGCRMRCGQMERRAC